MRTHLILRRFYRLPPHKMRQGSLVRWAWRRLAYYAQEHLNGLTVGSLLFALLVGSHVYYFNVLQALESNVDTARAQIDVAKQKRSHIQRNLTQLLRFHATYEREVLENVTTLRTNSHAPKPATSSDGLNINAVGEQYPPLLLNTTIKEFSDSVRSSEAEVAKRIADYNSAVNVYTNVLHQFPGNVFGPLLGYHDRPYFTPDDPSTLHYRELTP